MKIRLFVQIAASLAVGIFFTFSANGQSGADWNTYKQQNGIDAHWAYNDWVAAGCPHSGGGTAAIPSGPTPVQQMQLQGAQMMGTALGNAVGQMLFPRVDPAQQRAQQMAQQAQQQRMLAAKQLNDSGVYLFKQKNYAGAINEFQKALAQTPGDQVIINNIAQATQKMKDTAVAAQNSGALGQLLGDATAGSSVLDFDQLTHSQVPNPNASALSLVNLGSDPNVVDLRGTAKTFVDPASLKSQLDGVFANGTRFSAPSADMQQTLQTLDDVLDNKNKKSDEEFLKEKAPAWQEFMRVITSKIPSQQFPATPPAVTNAGYIGIRG